MAYVARSQAANKAHVKKATGAADGEAYHNGAAARLLLDVPFTAARAEGGPRRQAVSLQESHPRTVMEEGRRPKSSEDTQFGRQCLV